MLTAEQEVLHAENMGLVYFLANRHYREMGRVERDDILSAALHGHYKASKNYDASKGFKYSTYASRIIINEIGQVYRKAWHINNTPTVSLNKELQGQDGGIGTVQELLYSGENIEMEYIEQENIQWQTEELDRLLGKLDKRDRAIVCHYHGIRGYERKTQRELGDIHGYTQTHISRILRRCIKVMGEYINPEDREKLEIYQREEPTSNLTMREW